MSRKVKVFTYAGIVACAAVVTTVGLSGCSTTSGVEATGKTVWSDEGARELGKKVIFNNSSLAGDVQIVDMQSALAGDLMRAQVSLKSKDGDTLKLQYRFDWYDGTGMEINSGAGAWKPLLLFGKESKTVQGVAPDPRAKEFKLKIRESEE
jgi:uncharacterized protein YcfL